MCNAEGHSLEEGDEWKAKNRKQSREEASDKNENDTKKIKEDMSNI